jgi:PhnB protein
MDLSPYLSFNGQCAAAFTFYEQCLGGKIVMMLTHGESPMKDHVPADWQDKVMHATLAVGDKVLMGMDAPPTHYAVPQGIFVSITVAAAEAERVFKALAESGKVTMPFQQTFWSSGFGMTVDRFGIPWMVSSEQAPSPAGV